MRRRTRHLLVLAATVTIALTAAAPATAGFPGANGLIAFVRGDDIYTMTPQGGDVRRLTRTGDTFF